MVNMKLNEERNGVELYFDLLPSKDVMASLHSGGWRINKSKWCWYHIRTPEALEFAKSLAENAPFTSEEPVWMPDYHAVGSDPILLDSNVPIAEIAKAYFHDLDAYVEYFSGCGTIRITTLFNAMKTGRVCQQFSVSLWKAYDKNSDILASLNNVGISTVRQLYTAVRTGSLPPKQFTVSAHACRSVRTFSPFVEHKAARSPARWCVSAVSKAILCGQVWDGKIVEYLTDDFAYDASAGFQKGREIDLPGFAKELVEDPDGWSVDVSRISAGVIRMSCYHYRTVDLFYDETCDRAEALRRREASRNEIAASNQALLRSVIQVSPASLDADKLYVVEHLHEDRNTGRLEKRTTVMHRDTLFPFGPECSLDVTDIRPFWIVSAKLYRLDDTPKLHSDTRAVYLGYRRPIVTGYALNELLTEGFIPTGISDAGPFHAIEESLRAHFQPIQKCVNGTPVVVSRADPMNIGNIDYAEQHAKLVSEWNRIEI